MDLDLEKDTGLIPYVLSQILDTCVNGVTLSDPDQPDNPIVYANEAFERITGYEQEEIIGRNCRFLQGHERDQPGIEQIREAMRTDAEITVTLRNYKKDGTLFFNEFTIRPLFDRDGAVVYYLGIQHDVTNELLATEETKRLAAEIASLERSVSRP
jgi:PAS domain S-box-containing protein